MKRFAQLAVALAMVASGCNHVRGLEAKEKERIAAQTSQAGSARPLSKLEMGDPLAALQLGYGFYPPEAGWRWTKGRFAVVLGSPRAARAVLRFRFSLRKLSKVTLSARVNGVAVEPQSYAGDGEHVYERQLPKGMAGDEAAEVEFELDRVIAPEGDEKRELGVIALSVELSS